MNRPLPTQALSVKEIGSFHVGGRQVTLSGLGRREFSYTEGAPSLTVDPNGDFEVEQLYVQYVRLSDPRGKYPLLLWHGGGMSGVTWETTPDGRHGWQMFFLRAGHDVYVSDAVERGRAGWARYPEVFEAEPFFRTKKEAWELFRVGPIGSYVSDAAKRSAHAGQQFPVFAFDQFCKQTVPRWACNDASAQAAYGALVEKVGPCVVIVHSQGGNFGFMAAHRAPDKVKALVAVEPSGAPDPAGINMGGLRGVPHLFVWGDYLHTHPVWARAIETSARYRDALVAAGGTADWLELPKIGVAGNSHFPMMDRNSDEIARRIQDWFTQQQLMRSA